MAPECDDNVPQSEVHLLETLILREVLQFKVQHGVGCEGLGPQRLARLVERPEEPDLS